MEISHVPGEPDSATAAARVRSFFGSLGGRSLALPPDADPSPVLPGSANLPGSADLPGVWVSAPGAALDNGVLLYVHGGGFEHRMPDLIRLFGYHLSRATGRPVFVVHYRLAPADPYPAPLDDVLTAYRGLLDQGVPAERVAVLGESSGAALSLSALLTLKDSGTPPPATVITFSAVTDMTLASPSIDDNTAEDLGVDRALLTRLTGQYLGDARRDAAPQSPIHGDLAGLPPLLMAVGSAEALRDDTLRFARAAAEAGTRVSVDLYEGMPHAFQILTLSDGDPDGDGDPNGRAMLERVAAWIETVTARPRPAA